MEYQFSINKRLFSDLFAKYPNTFVAFCELVNNALQARAKEIHIAVNATPARDVSVSALQSIAIRDDGVGVPKSEFEWKILQIATDAKAGGKGIGRFSALQIGSAMNIETVAFDQVDRCFYRTSLPLDCAIWGDLKTLDGIRLQVDHAKLESQQSPYYQVTITNLYDEAVTKRESHKRLHRDLLPDRIEGALFARYADAIFRQTTKFFVNKRWINPAEHVVGEVQQASETFTALDGNDHNIDYQFMLVSTTEGGHRVFLRVDNCGIQTVSQSFVYDADIPESNRWFVFVDSPYFDQHADLFRNFTISELDPNAKHLITAIKEHVDRFFAGRYEHYRTFVERLRSDGAYPYRERKPSSESRDLVFNQIAFQVEQEHRLLAGRSQIRKLVYRLIDRALNQGDFEELLGEIVKLDPTTVTHLRDLLSRVDLEDVIAFSDQVARKNQFLDFLHELVYGAPAKHLKERKQLHKIVERHLWLFGESYAGTPILFSDKNLKNNLESVRSDFFGYEPSDKDENLLTIEDSDLGLITDLFFFNEKILDDGRREIMVVELKAPKVRIHQKELNQAEQYAFQIQKRGVFPASLSYKIVLVSSDLSEFVKSKHGQIDSSNPWIVYKSQTRPVEVWATAWSDIVAMNRQKLSYLGNALRTKDRGVRETFEQDFAGIPLLKLRSVLDAA